MSQPLVQAGLSRPAPGRKSNITTHKT